MSKEKIVQAIGKRKTSIARATIKEGKGIIRVNKELLDVYTPALANLMISEVLAIAGDRIKQVNISVNVSGGGKLSQAQAVKAAIGSVLVNYFKDEALKTALISYDRSMVVSDMRRKEMNTCYRSAPRARRQTSKR